MSYILTPIAVDLAKVTAAIGSKDRRLLATVTNKSSTDFSQIDEMDDNGDDDDEDYAPTSVEDALRHLIMEEPPNPDVGYKYGYALEAICKHFGEFLPNSEWSAMRWEWAETVDLALHLVGVPASVLRVEKHLMTRGSPILIPRIDDFPAIGFLQLDEIRTAHVAVCGAKLDAIEDGDARTSIEQLRSWLKSCLESRRDLICFYA